jgi:hypothetical protein
VHLRPGIFKFKAKATFADGNSTTTNEFTLTLKCNIATSNAVINAPSMTAPNVVLNTLYEYEFPEFEVSGDTRCRWKQPYSVTSDSSQAKITYPATGTIAECTSFSKCLKVKINTSDKEQITFKISQTLLNGKTAE